MKKEFLERISKIASDNVSSAQQILRDMIDLAIEFSRSEWASSSFVEDLKSICEIIASSQSQMAALKNTCTFINKRISSGSNQNISEYLLNLKEKINRSSQIAGETASSYLHEGLSYATISNSEFVLHTFESAARAKKFFRVFVLESRPLFEGRQTARALKEMGHHPVLVADAAAGIIVNEIDSAVVGADTIYSDGTLINKIGSFPLAAACGFANKKFYAVTSALKFDRARCIGDFKPRPESPQELFANPEIECLNTYFDAVPANFIEALITEVGIFFPRNSALENNTWGDAILRSMEEVYG
ncbi:MAG: translation initiation factor eIF-2B [Candidatus Kryptoniota bacterium]